MRTQYKNSPHPFLALSVATSDDDDGGDDDDDDYDDEGEDYDNIDSRKGIGPN